MAEGLRLRLHLRLLEVYRNMRRVGSSLRCWRGSAGTAATAGAGAAAADYGGRGVAHRPTPGHLQKGLPPAQHLRRAYHDKCVLLINPLLFFPYPRLIA